MGILSRFFGFQPGGSDEPEFSFDRIKDGLYHKLLDRDRLDRMKGLSSELDSDIALLREHVLNFNNKIHLVERFLKSREVNDLSMLKKELGRMHAIISREYKEELSEERYVVKALESIHEVIMKEKDLHIEEGEYRIQEELKQLKEDIERLEPCIIRQLKFFEQPVEEQSRNLKSLMHDINEEAAIIGYEEELIKSLRRRIELFEVEAIVAKD